MNADQPFSQKHRYIPTDEKITIREDAPAEFRALLIFAALDKARLRPSGIREIACRVLLKFRNTNNWSEEAILEEVEQLVWDCRWYEVYDLTESISKFLIENSVPEVVDSFETHINNYFRQTGIGWQLVNGVIETRGPEAFESSVRGAVVALEETGRLTARSEIHEALQDLSRRPEPDLTGAIQHAMVALECVSRDVCGDQKPTLGEIMKKYAGMLPQPLPAAVEKIWGYTSEVGRHLKEGRTPDREEAELVVGLAASIATYLARTHGKTD